MLAGLVQNPDANNPVNNEAAALDRRDVVLNRMAELRLDHHEAGQEGQDGKLRRPKGQPIVKGCVGTRYPFLCDYVQAARCCSRRASATTTAERNNMINRGGLTIHTAIDPEAQDMAQKRSAPSSAPRTRHLDDEHDPAGHRPDRGHGAEPAGDGQRQEEGRDLLQLLGRPARWAGSEGYQAGSTFKAFTAAAALEKGIPITKKLQRPVRRWTSRARVRHLRRHEHGHGAYKPKNSVGARQDDRHDRGRATTR